VLGRILGSNRQFIEDMIPHIGSLLSNDLREVVETAEILLIGTKAVSVEKLSAFLRPDTLVVDLVHLEKAKRLPRASAYEGICWQ